MTPADRKPTTRRPSVAEPGPAAVPVAGLDRQSRDYVQSLARGLEVIRAFSSDTQVLPLSGVCEKTGLTRATARRFLLTLVEMGYVGTDGRLFWLMPRVLELGFAYLSASAVPDLALPHLERLVFEVGESSEMAVLDGTAVVYVQRVVGPRFMTVSINVGSRMPAHLTSLGRVLLAGLPEDELAAFLEKFERACPSSGPGTSAATLRREVARAREAGWAMVDQELEQGLRAIAAPVRDAKGRVIVAAGISTHAARRSLESLHDDLLPALLTTVGRIESDLHAARLGGQPSSRVHER
jgi:IclR family pca regulon transcriptional regulator